MFKKLFAYQKKDSLIRDGFILFSASMVANVAAYFYHFYMGRVLGPEEYSTLGVILTLLYIISVPFYVIQMTITKFVASLKARKQEDRVASILRRSLRKMVRFGLVVLVVFLALSLPLAAFLRIPVRELLVFSPMVVLALLLPVCRGVLQGLQTFKSLGLNMVLEGLSKLVLGILLVMLGFHVSGAIGGIVLSYVIAFGAAFRPLRAYVQKEGKAFPAQAIYAYAIPVLVTLLALTLYYSMDVFLVKHYFSELEAGYYAAASLIGKIIFFGTFSLGTVMFPKVAEMHSLQKENKHLLTKSLLLMLGGAGVLVVIYFLFPQFIVLPLFGRAYLPVAGLIGVFSIIMTFFSFSYLLALYNLSVQRTRFIFILVFFNVLEVLLLVRYHATLQQVTHIFAALMVLLFLAMFAYTYGRRKG